MNASVPDRQVHAPNKPMVRIATAALAEPERNLGRPHIGQPLGSHETVGI
jgi:hypothetical protein